MKISEIFELGLVNDSTEVFIRESDNFFVLAHGNWFQDNVLNYHEHEAESFTWQDDNKIYIDIKG